MDLADPDEKKNLLYVEAEKIEDNIRSKLSQELVSFNGALSQSLTETLHNWIFHLPKQN